MSPKFVQLTACFDDKTEPVLLNVSEIIAVWPRLDDNSSVKSVILHSETLKTSVAEPFKTVQERVLAACGQ